MRVGLANKFQTDKRILVCSVAAYRGKHIPPGFATLVMSCLRLNIQIRFFAFDKYWQGFYNTKFLHQIDCLKAVRKDYDYVISVDAEDIVFLRPLEETYEIAHAKDKVTWCAERNCYPHPELASQYPDCPTTYKYLNGGGFFGKMNEVIECMEQIAAFTSECTDDQAALSKAYVTGNFPMRLDNSCEVFQTLFMHSDTDLEWRGYKLYNKETNTYPCILHANGKTCNMSFYKRFT